MHPDAEKCLLDNYKNDSTSGLDDHDFLVPARGAVEFAEGMCESAAEEALVDFFMTVEPGAERYLIPQVPLDVLASAAGVKGAEPSAHRRCDFLFCPPGAVPTVVEVDGSQHQEAKSVDRQRDRLLKQAGISTVRVPTAELGGRWKGPGLDSLQKAIDEAVRSQNGLHSPESSFDAWPPLVWGPIQVHRLVLAICEAVEAGFLSGERWIIELDDPTGLSAYLVGPYLATLAALFEIWGSGELAPQVVVFRSNGTEVIYGFQEGGGFGYEQSTSTDASEEAAAVKIILQSDWFPCEKLPVPDPIEPPSVVIRSTGVPVLPNDLFRRLATRPEGVGESPRMCQALETVMKAVFGFDEFREGQFEAISTVLAGEDCVVLLPTGAGKSMIYQLAGLILGGRVLVVDPIVSLIDDQIRGLTGHGIDRVRGITYRNSWEGHDVAKDVLFLFVSPERFQKQKFRDFLKDSDWSFPVNLVVVDEAHCVSEWGHDFRPAYLNFGQTVQRVCDPYRLNKVPILALTGTASQVVLSDVLFQLDISDNIISPKTFDRKELSYEVIPTSPNESEKTLVNVLKRFPTNFKEYLSAFSEPVKLPGIVFIPTVNGRHRSLNKTLDVVGSVIPAVVGFSGKPPKGKSRKQWEKEKPQNAEKFKQDQATAIVATKAFGMGIDKSNIRWIIHYGLPQSIESYYQEVGRAGRDREKSKCVLILSESDRAYNKAILESKLQQTASQTNTRKASDDISTVIWFYDKSFPSSQEDAKETIEMYTKLRVGSTIHLGEGESINSASERALYRLATLGVVEDYCIEGWENNEKAVVKLSDISPEQIVNNLLEFVDRSQPGQARALRSRLFDFNFDSPQSAIEVCSRELADFVYGTIGRSRLRNLYEMYELAVSGIKDSETIRQGILDYLSDGIPSVVAQELAQEDEFRYERWTEQWSQIASIDYARQWRGAAARLLGSYPDHPGLLATRAFAGALLSESSPDDFENRLKQSIELAFNRYQADPGDAEQMVMQILSMVSDQSEPLPVIANKPQDERLEIASACVAAARSTIPTCDMVNRWLEFNWHRSPDLVVFKLADSIETANKIAGKIAFDNKIQLGSDKQLKLEMMAQ